MTMNEELKRERYARYRECLQTFRDKCRDDQVLEKIALDREILGEHFGEPDDEAWNHRVTVLHVANLRRMMEIENACQQLVGISRRAFDAELLRELATGLFPADYYRRLAQRQSATRSPRRRRRDVRHG